MQRADGSGRFDLLVAGAAGVASVALVMGTLAVEQIRVTHEIQLWTPASIQSGDRVPVRALVMTDLDAAAGPRLVTEGVSAAGVIDDTDFESLAVELQPAAFESVQGDLGTQELPRVLARAQGPSGELWATAERAIPTVARVTEHLAVRGRLGDALQTLALSRTVEVEAAVPELDVRVQGGVCVPEHPCRLWFRRGASTVVPRLSECTTLDVGATTVGSALVSVDIVVHGPEARCRVELDPLAVATDLQIPVGLATPWIDVERSGELLRIVGEPPIGRDEMLIDVFVGGGWVGARTFRRVQPLELELAGLGVGMFRVQARADLGSSERAYQRALYAVHQGAREEDDLGEEAALVGILGRRAGLEDPEQRAWARLELEAELVDVPAPVSGLARDEARLQAVRTTMRWICGAGLLLGVLAILLAVLRRGLASAREAREVLVEAGAEGADDAGARRRSWLTVVAFVAAIGLAILLGAAFLVARPFFMG